MALPAAGSKGWGAVVLAITTTPQAIARSSHTRVLRLKNVHATVTCFLGGSDLTAANTATDGYPLVAGAEIMFTSDEGGESLQVPLYVVAATATSSTLAVLRGSV